ncbi:unnamed protein product [Mytilus coruscus]|uniref:Fibrinogen C-terminal domain-containing protein n=1 Tax=Mytilus coruscus TaxID=42192 RepID=A0A6J8D4R2_MYTCO|nr:unnamed protein product [Mytilus coruscus]
MYIHEDGKDYEDQYHREIVSIGDIEISYSYDWGNYFIIEYIMISKQGNEISYARREFGAVDPLKKETRQANKGKEVLTQLSEDLGLSLKDFIQILTSNFKVFQRRINGKINFYRDWESYNSGFGYMKGKYWLGNEHLHQLTSQVKYKLRIDMPDFENSKRHAVYSEFSFDDCDPVHLGKFGLHLSEGSGFK